MGRAQYRRYHRHHHRWGPTRRPVGPLPVLLCAAAVLAGAGVITAGVITVALVTMLSVLGPPMLFGVGAVVVMRHLHRSHRWATGRQQPMPTARPAQPVARIQPVPDWQATRARFAELRGEYGQFECDPLAVLRLPALTDVTVPSTGRFVEAFAEAQALDTDTRPPAAHCARFATAVDQAWRAWHAARDAAERIRLAGIPAPERATVQRAIKLLTMARDSDHDAERIAAYAKARAELAKLDRVGTLRLPPAAAAALDVASRGQLPAGEAVG
ncbi:MAG: hypothetical protein JO063_06925 [Pseudonocardiales bacterium]|nr:hypothetical protein [Pseudonocardiales bacterium]MBV9032641.1 hypothetical protein [Pseudonocardiales bacterium]MBW0009836.1 hypothetical protein [Pseudonocardiales bacterium]